MMSGPELELCCGCGEPLPEKAMQSVSHTINPGTGLCIKCGQKETMSPTWALGRKVGRDRAEAAMKGQRMFETHQAAEKERDE